MTCCHTYVAAAARRRGYRRRAPPLLLHVPCIRSYFSTETELDQSSNQPCLRKTSHHQHPSQYTRLFGMSVVSLGSALGTLGPKNDMNEDINITDNELLPGLAIDSKLEPKVKGWLSAEFPTETSKSMTPSSTQGTGSAEPLSLIHI